MPDTQLLDRFRRDLRALVGDAEMRLGVAVSGGPDSLALLLLAQAAAPGRVHAATVDHGLRLGSAAEAAFVAALCAERGIPHRVLRVSVAAGGDGVQAEARAARYAALAAWMAEEGLDLLLTAHHADDQAETLLMRLLRGSGLGGLAGIRARGPIPGGGGEAEVARPLLAWRRQELVELVRAEGIEAVADPSNDDQAYDRVRMRRRLAEADWMDAEPLARSAGALAEAEEALDWAADRLEGERVTRDGAAVLLDARGLPPELQRRLAARCLRAVAPEAAPRGSQLGALLTDLAEGRTVTLAGVLCSGGGRWRFEPAPPRRGS